MLEKHSNRHIKVEYIRINRQKLDILLLIVAHTSFLALEKVSGKSFAICMLCQYIFILLY